MPSLTRRRSGNLDHHETWLVYYGDVHVGTIGERSGVPVHTHQWKWTCGFYPGLHPGQHRYGTGATFDEARAGFEEDWEALLPAIPQSAFDEWRRGRELRAEIRAKRALGEKLDSEIPSSIMRCVCGVRFDSHKPAESYDHRGHIYAERYARTFIGNRTSAIWG